MSDRVLKFLLSELKTVRIICPHCEAVAEMPIDRLATRFETERKCLGCGESYGFGDHGNPLDRLGKVIAEFFALQRNTKFPDIEFVLPDPKG